MEVPFPVMSSADWRNGRPTLAVLPVGSFEQHGVHLPLVTDLLLATDIAARIAHAYSAVMLPALPYSCSSASPGFRGTVALKAETVIRMIQDVWSSLRRERVQGLIILNVNPHNHVLYNVAQEINENGPAVMILPAPKHWEAARKIAGLAYAERNDAHAGEAETAMMLALYPSLVHQKEINGIAARSPHLEHVYGIGHYTATGALGFPSIATSHTGKQLLEGLALVLDEDIQEFIREITARERQADDSRGAE